MEFRGTAFEFKNVSEGKEVKMDSLSRALAYRFYVMNNEEVYDTMRLRWVLEHSMNEARKIDPSSTELQLDWKRTIYVIPPYPANAELRAEKEGLLGIISADKQVKLFTLKSEYKRSGGKIIFPFSAIGYDNVEVKHVRYSYELRDDPADAMCVISSKESFEACIPFKKHLITLWITIEETAAGEAVTYQKLFHL